MKAKTAKTAKTEKVVSTKSTSEILEQIKTQTVGSSVLVEISAILEKTKEENDKGTKKGKADSRKIIKAIKPLVASYSKELKEVKSLLQIFAKTSSAEASVK